ncbi:BTAD domain-containing putative transcriptional regulator [Actinoplanes sp. NPDC023714]|uniref:AfsR/SARP family transcriptional regulator n=1 Tax=Actinoplanes sp. NPDC023714 TaxID=3154322 RepID=UPI00340C599E
MSIMVRLLGPVELRGEDGPADPGPAKRRATLAALALEAGRPVTLNRLTDLLWAGEPPASAVANIRNHVAALRRALGDRLVSRQGSYQLVLARHELDVAEFQQLAESGRAALAAGEATRAEPELAASLRLWRGPAGHGLPRGTGLDVLLAGLEADRLRVFEDLTDARLDLGYAGELVPPLRDHLAAHPLRERAWAQLMLALYRAGDLAAALSAYRQAQAGLRAQLGVDPGRELAELHVAMLERAPRLDPWVRQSVRRGLVSAVEVPRELPPDPAVLEGRDAEIEAVVEAIARGSRGERAGGERARAEGERAGGERARAEGERAGGERARAEGERAVAAVVVHGPAGSGKTALVTRAGHRLAGRFPDGQIFAVAGPDATAAELVARVLRALGVPAGEVPERADERIGRYRSLLAARRVLVVVDGAADAGQVRPLIPASASSALLVTGRWPLLEEDGLPHVAVPARDRAAHCLSS